MLTSLLYSLKHISSDILTPSLTRWKKLSIKGKLPVEITVIEISPAAPVQATGPQGAVVTYAVRAIDVEDGGDFNLLNPPRDWWDATCY